MNKKISVIIGTYNCKDLNKLHTAVKSILDQSYTNIEIIICDDGSDVIISSKISEMFKDNSKVILFRNHSNAGLANALNLCLKISSGSYIARIDDDDISDSNRLEKQLEFLETNEEYDFVGCCSRLINETSIWGYRYMPERPQKEDFLKGSPFMHPTIMFRRETLTSVKGYRVSKETRRMEDYDLFMRLYACGYKGYNLQQIMYSYYEDKYSYKKRKYRYRFDEMKIRYRNYKLLGLYPKGYLYVLKPIIVGLIPHRLLNVIRYKLIKRWSYNEE